MRNLRLNARFFEHFDAFFAFFSVDMGFLPFIFDRKGELFLVVFSSRGRSILPRRAPPGGRETNPATDL